MCFATLRDGGLPSTLDCLRGRAVQGEVKGQLPILGNGLLQGLSIRHNHLDRLNGSQERETGIILAYWHHTPCSLTAHMRTGRYWWQAPNNHLISCR